MSSVERVRDIDQMIDRLKDLRLKSETVLMKELEDELEFVPSSREYNEDNIEQFHILSSIELSNLGEKGEDVFHSLNPILKDVTFKLLPEPRVQASLKSHRGKAYIFLTPKVLNLPLDETLFVIGHEIAHLLLGHEERNKQIAHKLSEISDIHLNWKFLMWRRRSEFSADRIALQICKSLNAALSVLKKAELEQESSSELDLMLDRTYRFTSDHPFFDISNDGALPDLSHPKLGSRARHLISFSAIMDADGIMSPKSLANADTHAECILSSYDHDHLKLDQVAVIKFQNAILKLKQSVIEGSTESLEESIELINCWASPGRKQRIITALSAVLKANHQGETDLLSTISKRLR